jgi:hypothetical protein
MAVPTNSHIDHIGDRTGWPRDRMVWRNSLAKAIRNTTKEGSNYKAIYSQVIILRSLTYIDIICARPLTFSEGQ